MKKKITIGSRGSKLALLYAQKAKDTIIRNLNLSDEDVVIKSITTKGDQFKDARLSEFGGKGLFSNNIEKELQDESIDIAVHALKDLPAIETNGLIIDSFLERNDPKEILISRNRKKLMELDVKAIIGTSSYRREFQIKKIRPDINCKIIRGNVDTRIKKLQNGEFDAIILAVSGLKRLGVKKNFHALDINFIVPAVGQGAIALVGNKKNTKINKLIKKVNDEKTFIEVSCEREFLRALDGSCKTPIGAYAEIKDFNRRDYISFLYFVSSIDGKNFVKNKKNINLKDYLSESYNLGEDVKRELKL